MKIPRPPQGGPRGAGQGELQAADASLRVPLRIICIPFFNWLCKRSRSLSVFFHRPKEARGAGCRAAQRRRAARRRRAAQAGRNAATRLTTPNVGGSLDPDLSWVAWMLRGPDRPWNMG